MDTTVIPEGVMSMADFMAIDIEGRFEFIDGKVIPVSPTLSKHGHTAIRLLSALLRHVEDGHLGALYFETAYVLEYLPDWVKGSRVPDLMFFNAERYAAYTESDPSWGDKPFLIVPDWTVEILSKVNTPRQMDAKVAMYLEDGVRLIWVIDPDARTITVHAADRGLQFFQGDQMITGAPVLPDFQCALPGIFL